MLWFNDKYGSGLQNLLNLSPVGWKSLRSIVVTIGTTNCTSWVGPTIDTANTNCHGKVPEILDNDAQLEATGVLSTWRLICFRLAMYNKEEDRLQLRLICGAATKKTAAEFLAPIHNLPRLKALSIRMGPNRNFGLQQMIMTTIRQKTDYFSKQPSAPFPFLRLPVELQIHILEYSGLIAPEALMFRFFYKFFTPTDCRHFDCNALPIGMWNCQECYSPSTHTAFSTIYPCWTMTYALFLVSKAIRQLALSIYYSKNVFEIRYE
ncbi:hypothetical protein BDW59DRAFT_161111 [Aspergillus cavernicola]|uniref:F-box domain-containing protein n=1 Tax=Aspergillus cavernicola TaxID=176166 RepID=A0ABR4IHD4_9EURO